MSQSDGEIDLLPSILFQEPDGFFAPETPATFCQHTMLNGKVLKLRLVGSSPLWGHLLWNASRVLANFLEEHTSTLVEGKDVLEFGAGAGLPSLVCALNGARKVIVTDYPEEELIENLRTNIEQCGLSQTGSIIAEGYVWGNSLKTLTAHLNSPPKEASFDLLILADLLFNHSEHSKLIFSVQSTLKRCSTAKALVFFTPHRPWLFEKDLAFFDLAREGGLSVEKVLEERLEAAMKTDGPLRKSIHDGGDEPERKIVYGYELKWAALS